MPITFARNAEGDVIDPPIIQRYEDMLQEAHARGDDRVIKAIMTAYHDARDEYVQLLEGIPDEPVDPNAPVVQLGGGIVPATAPPTSSAGAAGDIYGSQPETVPAAAAPARTYTEAEMDAIIRRATGERDSSPTIENHLTGEEPVVQPDTTPTETATTPPILGGDTA